MERKTVGGDKPSQSRFQLSSFSNSLQILDAATAVGSIKLCFLHQYLFGIFIVFPYFFQMIAYNYQTKFKNKKTSVLQNKYGEVKAKVM